MSKLLEYINVVDKNAVARAAHNAAPVESMAAFGLSVDEREAVLLSDNRRLAAALGMRHVDIPAMHTPNTVFVPAQQFSGRSVSVH